MYEPYTEDKKINVDLKRIKEKLIQKATGLKSTKWAMIILVLALIGISGGITGYVSYTSKITEVNSQLMVLEKQMEACNQALENSNQNLEMCNNDLAETQNLNQLCESNLQNTESSLDVCQSSLTTAESDLGEIESELTDLQEKYDSLDANCTELGDDKEKMECEYAKHYCPQGFSYYFIKNNAVVCCIDDTIDSCYPEEPEYEDEIREINC